MEFQSWPKISRLFRDCVITEKIDGTNAAILIHRIAPYSEVLDPELWPIIQHGVDDYYVGAQSRNRLIFPGKDSDNYGFASWVRDNAEDLIPTLGEGRHFGEWWGKGIARKYNMDVRAFSLFDAKRYKGVDARVGDAYIQPVPVLYEGPFSTSVVREVLSDLDSLGSHAAAGFRNAEGVVVFHTHSKVSFKVTLDNEDKGKWESEA